MATTKTTNEKCRLVRMEIENFMRCRLVRIGFGADPVTEIRGLNGAGKSSVIRAFWALIGGKDACPEDPIRHGAESAQIIGELSTGVVIKRRFTSTGNTYLEAATKDGATYRSPQKILDDLIGPISFDPLAFKALAPKAQAEALRRIAGVDVTPLDAKRKQAYDARTLANRDVDQLRARLAAVPELEAPDEPVSAADLLAEHERRQKVKGANDLARRDVERHRDAARARKREADNAAADVVRLREQLAAAEQRQVAADQAYTDAVEAGRNAAAAAAALVDPDLEEVPRKIREVEAVNDRVRQRKQRAALAVEVTAAEEKAKRLTQAVAAVDAEKAAALAAAKFPIAGLGFGADGVTFEGVPFEQASQAEQIRVSMAMGLALNPRLPVVCIRDGSLLDERSLGIVRAMAAQAGAQVLLEIVGKGGSGIVIEDGQVEGAAAPALEAAP